MNSYKKLAASVACLAVATTATAIFPELRRIGTTWTSNAGFFRLIVLSTFCFVGGAAPLACAVLVWFGYPKKLHKQPR